MSVLYAWFYRALEAVKELGIPAPRLPIVSWNPGHLTVHGVLLEVPDMNFFEILTAGGFEIIGMCLIVCLVQQAVICRKFGEFFLPIRYLIAAYKAQLFDHFSVVLF
jgi:hypothetical protein